MANELRKNKERNIVADNKKEYMKQYGHLWYIENKEKHSKQSRDNYLKNRKQILSRKRLREPNDEVRTEILSLLGNRCSNPNCAVIGGMTDIRALQIDHINGGGRKEIEKFSSRYAYYKYVLEQLKAGSKEYQCLCANCNWIKIHEKREFKRRIF